MAWTKPLSGKTGTVTSGSAIAHITKWDLDMKADNPKYVSSSTGGVTGRVAGNTDFSGSFECLVQGAFSISVGSSVTLVLASGTDGTSTGPSYSCPALISGVKHAVDVESAAVQRITCTFEARDAVTIT